VILVIPKGWLCTFFGHDWDMVFPNEDSRNLNDPFDWTFVCKRCGRQTKRMEDTVK